VRYEIILSPEALDDFRRLKAPLRAAVRGAIEPYLRHVGFQSEDDWFEYRLERDPRFLQRIETARASLRSTGGIRLEEIEQ
jgi:hypothetical protein